MLVDFWFLLFFFILVPSLYKVMVAIASFVMIFEQLIVFVLIVFFFHFICLFFVVSFFPFILLLCFCDFAVWFFNVFVGMFLDKIILRPITTVWRT